MAVEVNTVRFGLKFDGGDQCELPDNMVKKVGDDSYLHMKATNQLLIRLIMGTNVPNNSSIAASETIKVGSQAHHRMW